MGEQNAVNGVSLAWKEYADIPVLKSSAVIDV
jgi:hypothetical protein